MKNENFTSNPITNLSMQNNTPGNFIGVKLAFLALFFFTTSQIWAQFSFSENSDSLLTIKSDEAQKLKNTANTQTCDGDMQTILKDDFGSGTADRGSKPSSTDFNTTYSYSSGGISPNTYGIMKSAYPGNNAWSKGGDHTTGDGGNGYMLVFDANNVSGSVFYEKKYSNLCSGSTCTFSIYAANLVPTTYSSTTVKPKVKIELVNPSNNTVLKSFTSNELQLSQQNSLLWNELSLSFTIPSGLNSVTVRVSNAQTAPDIGGNDVAFDDASFSICVPLVTASFSNSNLCEGESTTISVTNNNTSASEYKYQWQKFDGMVWEDILGATSLEYTTPPLNTTTKYRFRYAETGIDISNNNNLNCSGNKEIKVEVTPNSTVTTGSSSPLVFINNAITNITHTTTLATGIGTATGLPSGVTASWSSDTITISGTPTESGIFKYSIPLTSACGNVAATGTITVTPKPADIVTTGVSICKGGTGSLTATNSSVPVTKFSGHWNSATDPQAFMPYSEIGYPMIHSNVCKFSTTVSANYTATTFTVSLSGTYTLKMTDTDKYDGAAYIYKGNFTPGSCSGGGTWIMGSDDDDTGVFQTEPKLKVFLEEGTVYTLISTQWLTESATFIDDYTWTVTPPDGGQFIFDTLNYWYTSPTGGNPVGWGNSFNPVGVSGSGLADTNTAGKTTYYVGNDIIDAKRVPVDFVIKEDMTATTTTTTACINNALPDITHTTTLATGIGTATGLPAGVTATWASDKITISGTPTESGIFNYSIPLTGACGNVFATGTITVNKITAIASNQIDVKCKGDANGSVTITPNGGTAPYTITPAQTGLTAGLHTFTVKDSNNCETTLDVTISEPGQLTATASNQINILRKGDATGSVTITPSGGTLPYTITPAQTGLTAGLHTFTVKDGNNCETTIDVTISEPNMELSAVIASQVNLKCKGDTNGAVVITPNGGTAPYTITPAQTGLIAGSHIFTITDNNNISVTIPVTIIEPAQLTALASNQIDVKCKGDANGSVTITPNGGTAPYTITPAQTGLTAGIHTFTVKDSNSCETTVEVTISEPEQLTATASNEINILRKGDATGSVTITPSGGTVPYIITPAQTGLTAGLHTFTVKDSNNCEITVDVSISEPDMELSAVIASQVDLKCKGDTNGSVVITPNGGTAPYTITPAQTGLIAGNHIFTITDNNNISVTIPVTIIEPAQLTALASNQIDVKCKGEANGSVTITPNGGTAPYTITPAQTDLTAGLHTFTVKDSNSCETTVEVTILEPEQLTATASNQINILRKGDATGSVTITPNGGTLPYTITPAQTGLAAGLHTFTVKDSNNCEITVDVTISEPDMELSAVIASQVDLKCKGDTNGSVVITPNGGTAPYTITPAQTGLIAGNHIFTITDNNNISVTIPVTILEPAQLTALASNQIDVKCKGEANGSVTITPNGGTAPYTITPAQTGLTAGIHTFTVTDNNNCTTSLDVTILEPAQLTALASNQVNVKCKGEANGSVTITPNGGTAPYTITPAQTGLTAGLHTFTVTDNNNCTTSLDVTILEPAQLTALASNQIDLKCKGDANGSVTITPNGGTAPYTITPAQTGLKAGLHTFTVTDNNNCTTSLDVTILEPAQLTALASNQIDVKCKGEANGSVTITPSGGTAPYTITPAQTGLTAGLHTFTVTDNNNCTTSLDVTILEPAQLTALASNQIDVKCKGEANGSVTITPNGGTAPYTITPVQTDLTAGIHTFTVTDNNNCTTSLDVTILEPAQLTALASNQVNVKCKGDANGSVTITPNGGTAPYTVTPAQTSLTAGLHTFTVTDNNNCTTSLDVTILEPAQLTALASNQINVKCKEEANGSVKITPNGGTAPYTITPAQTGLAAGLHTFTVKDSNSCTTSLDVTILEPAQLTALASNQIDVKCKGEANGSVVITPNGGTAPYTITPAQTGLTAGKHTFTVKDDNKCEIEIEVTISEPEILTATASNLINVKCKGEANGSVVITPNGGTAPYNITPVQTGLIAGKHTFTITDSNNCTTTTDITISEPEVLTATSSNVVNVKCKGEANGSVTITPTGGTTPYTITPAQTGLTAGIHTFTVTDNNNCTTSLDVTILEPAQLTALASNQVNVKCKGEANGSVTITPNGGTAPYTITPAQTGLTAGKHTFTITDSNNCTTTTDVTISEPEVLTSTSSNVVNVKCKGEANGSVVITPNGGTAPYTITPAQTGLTAGLHTFTVTDNNNCTTSLDVTILEPAQLTALASNQVNVKCKGEANGSITITPNGGTAPYTITPAQTGLTAGLHTFTVTDNNNCTTSLDVTILEPAQLTALASNQVNVKCKGEANGSVVITPNGGTAPYTVNPAQTGLTAGKHTFTITDSNNCTTTTDVIISEPEKLTATSSNVVNVKCKGEANGSVTITPNGGTAPYTITPAQTALTAGLHTFTVTDNNNCTASLDVTILEPAQLTALASNQINVKCKGEANGSVVITPNGGTAPYTVTPAQTGLTAGKHTFTITDSNNCTTTTDVTISEPEKLTATSSNVVNVKCKGEANGSVVITPNGGTAPYTITPVQTGLIAGKHTFTVTDNNNCTASLDVTILEPAQLTALASNQINVKCKGEANGSVVITPNGGTAPYTITPAQTGLTAGLHTFTVTDNNNCTTTTDVTISEPEKLTATTSNVVNVKCKGEANGSVVITPNGGKTPYTITPVQTGLTAGKHTFTITDSNDCTTTIDINISEPEKLTATTSNVVNVTCNGQANGSVLITPNGGTAPYNITPAQKGLTAGKHTFTIIDSNNCVTTTDVTISEPEVLTATASNVVNVTCKGEANGSVEITPNGGRAPYTITPAQTNLAAGPHTFTVIDSNTCRVEINVIIKEPNALEAKVLGPVSPELCFGNKDGFFTIEVLGGNKPYLYSLDEQNGTFYQGSSNQTEFLFDNLSGGNHVVYIKDSKGCTTQVKVKMPNAILINPVAHIDTSCENNTSANSVTVTVDKSITNPDDVDYALDREDGVYQSGNIFKNVASGNHIIYARHTNGCIQPTKEFTINYIEPLKLTLADGELNEIVATATGGEGQYRYSFEGESYNTNNKFIIYKSGMYTVTVTDQNGCTATASRYFEYIDVCIPNNFTPNGDGINDEWGPGCSVNYKHLTFTVFDRYGRIIGNFKYGQKWDGKYNGTELTSGDYWYVFKLNDNKDNREFVGHFTLYR